MKNMIRIQVAMVVTLIMLLKTAQSVVDFPASPKLQDSMDGNDGESEEIVSNSSVPTYILTFNPLDSNVRIF